MIWRYFKITNYIGIADGLGLDMLEIEFSKCQNNICVIVGKNGSGKSTLEKALSPLPDSSSDYVPGATAEKCGCLLGNDGTIYEFKIISACDGNGNRKPTKAFFRRNSEELNPNGNVTSYKEIVESELDMDPNFMSLTRLSSDDRGLADKKPAERKKYVSAIVSCLDAYTNINKTLVKKSSIFKSHINSLVSKINTIGDLSTARMNLAALDDRLVSLESYIGDIQREIVKLESIVESKDPSNSIQDQYNKIATEVDVINDDLKSIERSIIYRTEKLGIDKEISLSELDKLIADANALIASYNAQIRSDRANLESLTAGSEEMNISIHNKQNKIDALKLDGVYDELLYSIEKYQDTVNKQEEILRTCGLEGVTDISTEEYVMIFTKLKQYRDIVFKIYDVNQDIIDKAIEYATTYGYVHDDIIALENSISNSQSVIDNLNSEITKYTMMLESIKILDQRPAECSIDTCPFIAKALEDSKEEPEKWIKTCYADITSATASIHDKKQKLEELKEVAQVVDSIEFIIKDALDNYDILSKFKESHMFCYREDLVTRLSNHNSFNEVEDCDKYIQLADSINGYRNNKNILKDLLAQKTVYDSKIELMDELTNEIDELYTKLTGAETKINEYYDSIEFNSGLVRTQEDRVIKFNELRDYLLSRDNRLAQKEDLKIQFSKIRDDIAEIKDSVDRLNRKRHEMDQANAEIKPLKESRDQLVYSIKRAEEYDAELQDYQGRYNTIETLKKYSSPTSGIQTIYMNLYMNKTLEMANDLLKYLFNGYLELLPYVINEDEFRIPVKHGNGMISDDISSCSTAQICMISMVVTISLSLQSSGIFNIFRFDEIDGGLDTDNRLYFFDTLKRMCSELGIQQMIVISHSIESNMNGVDVIKLATPSNIEYDLSGVNVIYDYNRRWR